MRRLKMQIGRQIFWALCFALPLLAAGCRTHSPRIDDTFVSKANQMPPSQSYANALPYLDRLSSDADYDQASLWLCTAALQDYPPAYHMLAQFYMGVKEDENRQLVPFHLESQNEPKFNVALGLSFLVLAKENKKDKLVASQAERLYIDVIKRVGVEDGIRAKKYYGRWLAHQAGLKKHPRLLSYQDYNQVVCLWRDARA